MDVTRLLIALFVGMAVLIFLIMKTRLHPSLSLVISACVVGIVGGVELASIPGLITSGFGNTLAGIGLVIAFGCMMGQIMEESNSAKVMAHTFIKALHGKNEEIALAITGFLVSIPIFADSALILLAPLVKSISQTKKKSLTGLALAMACALNITHASVPPTPGPLAVIAQFGDTIDLGTYILFAIAMGIPLMVLIGIMSRIVGRKWYKVVDENGEIVDVAPENIEEYARISSQATVPELDPNESYPSVVMSFAPIFVPVILILASTFTSMMYKGDPTPVTEIIGFLGSPVIAISISLLVSIYGLAGNKSRQEVLDCLERGVKSCGTVILITGVLVANMLGQWVVSRWEWFLDKIPVVRPIYSGVKQILATVLSDRTQSFREVVLIEFPISGCWTYGFIVATPGKETLETLSATEMVTVFVPTAPNPTSGYVIMVERDKLHKTSATIEQAFKFHVSLGVMTPEGALRGASEKRDASAENQAKKPAG